MLKTEKIKHEIDLLPDDMLNQVEDFIKTLRIRKKTEKKRSSLLADLAELAIDVDLPKDYSKQHDHYLYGMPKK